MRRSFVTTIAMTTAVKREAHFIFAACRNFANSNQGDPEYAFLYLLTMPDEDELFHHIEGEGVLSKVKGTCIQVQTHGIIMA